MPSLCVAALTLCSAFARPAGSQTWRPVGPIKPQSLSGGNIQAVEFFGKTGYVSASSQLYRTTDFGENWVRLGKEFELGSAVRYLAMAGDFLFAGTGNGVYRSQDRGESWTKLPPISDLTIIEGMFVYRGQLLVVDRMSASVHRYSDSAAAWIRLVLIAPFSDITYPKLFAADDSALYVGGRGLFKSLDGGTTWMDMMPGLYTVHVHSQPRNPTGYVQSLVMGKGGLYASLVGGIYKSADGGSTWSALFNIDTGSAFTSMVLAGDALLAGGYGDTGWRIPLDGSPPSRMGLRSGINTIGSSDSGIFIGTTSGLYRSDDVGATWRPNSLETRKVDIGILTCQNGILHAAGRLGALYYTLNQGATWITGSDTQGLYWIKSLAWNGNALFAVPAQADGAIYLSEEGGTAWTKLGSDQDSLKFEIVAASAGILYAAALDIRSGAHVLLGSDDRGRSWKPASDPIDNGRRSVNSLAFGPSRIHVGTDSGYFRLDAATGKVEASGLKGKPVLRLFVWEARLFASGEGTDIWRSPDQGLTWEKAEVAVPWSGNITAFTGHAQTVYAGTYGSGVYRSTNGGSTWEPFQGEGLNPLVSSLVMDRGRIYAGTSTSVYSLDLEGTGAFAGGGRRSGKSGMRSEPLLGNGKGLPYLEALQEGSRYRIIRLDGRQVADGLNGPGD